MYVRSHFGVCQDRCTVSGLHRRWWDKMKQWQRQCRKNECEKEAERNKEKERTWLMVWVVYASGTWVRIKLELERGHITRYTHLHLLLATVTLAVCASLSLSFFLLLSLSLSLSHFSLMHVSHCYLITLPGPFNASLVPSQVCLNFILHSFFLIQSNFHLCSMQALRQALFSFCVVRLWNTRVRW